MTEVIGKYATEVADIKCPECGEKNRINTEGIEPPKWECKNCNHSPNWKELFDRDDYYPCNWCGKDISDDNSTVVHCRECMKESQMRARIQRNQRCPHCDERITADDLRKIKEAKKKARKKVAGHD